jgi:2-polyprenyl-6-methoxyphenol hydroxylase-like FAD-dependent oxidoreductase
VADLKSVLTEQLWADFEATCAETGMGETTLSVHDASIIANRVNRGPKPYTVDRSCLRNVLMKGLGDTLQWNKSFIRYETNGDEVTAYFEDGSAEKGALLVGVDGWRSAVRKQSLPNYKLVDTEACTIFGKTFITPELESRFPASAMKWMTLCRDMPLASRRSCSAICPSPSSSRLSASRSRATCDDVPPDYVYWALLVPKKLLAPTSETLARLLAQPARDLSLLVTSEWHPSIRSLFELQDASQTSAIQVFSAPPTIAEWTPNARITLMGDAIHTLSPAGGVGAVTTLKDAVGLTKILAEQGLSDASIGAYEAAMRAYASASVARSFAGAHKLYGMPPFEVCQSVQV